MNVASGIGFPCASCTMIGHWGCTIWGLPDRLVDGGIGDVRGGLEVLVPVCVVDAEVVDAGGLEGDGLVLGGVGQPELRLKIRQPEHLAAAASTYDELWLHMRKSNIASQKAAAHAGF